MAIAPQEPKLTPKDYGSEQDVRWCPGCGDYSILTQMKKALANMQIPKKDIAFISGIGCSSRFPYYMDTYGLHSIHGRAPAFATGLKIMRPELHVFVITGDGDALSIGGNHLIHAIRRNVDITILLFNNRIYGLTKGQYSPTSECGKKTKSTPYGSVDNPLHPLRIALGAEASFVARSVDVYTKHLAETLEAAARHKGTSFVEILQNCNIFNDGAWEWATDRKLKSDTVMELEDGQPMRFGKDGEKGIRLNADHELEAVVIGENGVSESDLLVHDSTRQDPTRAYMLSGMNYPEFPAPVGIFRQVHRPIYDEDVRVQVEKAQQDKPGGDLKALLHSGETWVVN
ncbi:MAG: 2-oxoacid:ferredoxin oxidoreductase subunit beta [Candidatus Hinthialibacter antarcticus]|nr:2-oxoacid:ferredoxin oxidoreductase subunit beta [Candidatus Hinthialibacter antarcticus]